MPETFMLGKSHLKFSCFFKSYIANDMDENNVLASLPSVTLRSSEHLPGRRYMTNYVTVYISDMGYVNKNR